MAKTRAQPFGNFDTSGALAGIRATVEGAQFEAALKQRSWENLLGTVERTVTGISNRKLAREQMANQEEEWRARLAQQESQFTRSLEEQRSERAESQSWREKLFEYGKFKDVQGERQAAIERLMDMKERRRLESRSDTLMSMGILREQQERSQTLMMDVLQKVQTGELDQDAGRAILTNLQAEGERRKAAWDSQVQASGFDASVVESLRPDDYTAMSELLVASLRDRASQESQVEAPAAGGTLDERIAALEGEIAAFEKTPADRRTHFATQRYQRNVTALSEIQRKKQEEALTVTREHAVQAVATRAGMAIEDPAARNRWLQRLQGILQMPAEQFPQVLDAMEKELEVFEAQREERRGASKEAAALDRQQREDADDMEYRRRRHDVAKAKAEAATVAWAKVPVGGRLPTDAEQEDYYASLLEQDPDYNPEWE